MCSDFRFEKQRTRRFHTLNAFVQVVGKAGKNAVLLKSWERVGNVVTKTALSFDW
jgi:hypothetical protein